MTDQLKSDLPPADRPQEASNTDQTPYTAFYTFALRDVIVQLDDAALRIYVLLATYADGRGICWPGMNELEARSGLYRKRIIQALEALESLGLLVYVRRACRDPLTGQWLNNVYGLTPKLYKGQTISEPYTPESQFSPQKSDNQNHQQESITRIKNQNQELESTTTTTNQIKPSKADDRDSGSQPQWADWRAGRTHQIAPGAQGGYANTSAAQTARNAHTAQSADQKPPPPFRDTPSPDLSQYQRPLPDAFAEQQAERLHQRAGNMSMPNARALVAAHGVGHVAAALALLGRQTRIENPGGYVRALLQRGAVDPTKDGESRESDWGIAGEMHRRMMAESEQSQTESEAQNGTND